MRSRQQRKKPPHSVQETIPYERMWPDGICRVSPNYYTKTVQFWDINYQLAQNEDKGAIFEGWCDFLNAFDSSVHLQLSFLNLTANADAVEQRILLPDKADGFDAIRREYTEMLQNQLAKGSNGLSKRKYLTFGVESENYRTAKPRLERIETDLLNHFKRLGAAAAPMDGRERLKLMYDMFHLDAQTPFLFDWKWLAPTGLRTKDFIVPSSFKLGERQRFGMGSKLSSVSFFSILASELNDRCLAECLAMDSSLVVSFHLQAIYQTAAIKDIKAIPHKERTTKRTKKGYNKEVKKQLTMSLISDELGQASTKKKEFLGIMEKLIPWSEWVGIVQPHYYEGERGNKPYDLELMLRIYVLQHLYNLADDAARNEIIDSRAFSQFCGVDSSNQVPDGDTIGRFRHILERNQLGEAFFTNVVESLQKCNLMLKKGTIVDSTLIAAPSSTKNKEKQRDPEAHSVKKGNQWYFGYKEHIGVDADSGLVHTLETTAANVHDSNMVVELLQGTEEDVYGDSGYLGAEKKDDAILVNNEGKPIRYQINKRPSQLKKASGEKFELLKAIEHAKSSVRSKVEHVFCVIKRIFHFCKTRFRGREKLHQHCCTLFALANLYLARNRMKVA